MFSRLLQILSSALVIGLIPILPWNETFIWWHSSLQSSSPHHQTQLVVLLTGSVGSMRSEVSSSGYIVHGPSITTRRSSSLPSTRWSPPPPPPSSLLYSTSPPTAHTTPPQYMQPSAMPALSTNYLQVCRIRQPPSSWCVVSDSPPVVGVSYQTAPQ